MELARRLSRQALKLDPKEKQLRTTMVEEEDEEGYLNSTQNPLDDSELSLLISSITGDMDNNIWINSKSTMATAI